MNKEEYAEYLWTPRWQEIRKAALKRADDRCQLCYGKRGLQVHHRTYERVGREKDSDLTVLCRKCHEHFHGVNGGPSRSTVTSGHKAIRGDDDWKRIESAILKLNPARTYTTREIAGLAGVNASRTGTRLRHLSRAKKITKVAKKTWQSKDAPKRDKLREENERLHEVQQRINSTQRPDNSSARNGATSSLNRQVAAVTGQQKYPVITMKSKGRMR